MLIIKDKSKKIELQNAGVQMVRGKTRIELYNPNTRIKKVYNDENTFYASHIANAIKNLGMGDASPLNHDNIRNFPVWNEIVGGLFLFRDTIENDEEFMPAGNKMIGNGALGIANGSAETDPPEMGSYNYAESSYSDSAITQVYGFDTNQANGDINCVCLTSRTGGYIGYGNSSGMNKSRWDFTRGLNFRNINIGMQESYGARVATGNRIFYAYIDGNTLVIRTKRVPLTKLTLFDNQPVEDLTFDISETHVKNYGGCMASISNGKVIISRSAGNLGIGDTFYYLEFDPDTNTISEKSIVNSSGEAFSVATGASIAHGKMFIPTYGQYKIYVFDVATGIFEGKLTTTAYSDYYGCYEMPNGMAFIVVNGVGQFYDTENKTSYPTNGQGGGFYDSVCNMMQYNDRYSLYAYNNPLYLATINNLEETVHKTAAQTMKVTYTLTEV